MAGTFLNDKSELTSHLTKEQRKLAWDLAYQATGEKAESGGRAALHTFAEIERYFALVLLNTTDKRIPEVLFDGWAVRRAMSDDARVRTNNQSISDVLDAVVKLMRNSPPTL